MAERSRGSWTRRQFVTGGIAASGALLAGCTGAAPGGSGDDSSGESYSVTMEPVGEVTFERVPEKWVVYEPGYADMGVALGQSEGLAAVGVTSRYHTSYYDELDGVSVAKADLTQLYQGGVDKEVFLSLDADVHLIDPNWLTENGAFGLDESDVEQIADNVAPFAGNTIFRRTDSWHDYEYYSLYEAFGKIAEVFQERDRYEAFKELHDDFIDDVQSDLPSSEQRPNAALVWAGEDDPEQFTPYYLSGEGTNKKQFRDLGIRDALAETEVEARSTSESGTIDYETLLEVDPDALLIRGHEHKSREEFRDTVVAYMRDHDAGSELAAVQDDRVFRGGPIYQGPIQNLFLTERFAKLFFPDRYSGELFDRQAVADIVAGDV